MASSFLAQGFFVAEWGITALERGEENPRSGGDHGRHRHGRLQAAPSDSEKVLWQDRAGVREVKSRLDSKDRPGKLI